MRCRKWSGASRFIVHKKKRLYRICRSPVLRFAHLFVTDHACASITVVEVVGDSDHSHRGDVVGRSGLNRASASHAAKHLDGDDRSLSRVHAVSVARC